MPGTRIVEIPLCDRCSRDGRLIQIVPLDGGEPFVICRCDRHLDALAREHVNGSEPAPERPTYARGDSPAQAELLELIRSAPDLSPAEYAERLGKSRGATSHLGAQLAKRGLITTSGDRRTRRYHLASAS